MCGCVRRAHFAEGRAPAPAGGGSIRGSFLGAHDVASHLGKAPEGLPVTAWAGVA